MSKFYQQMAVDRNAIPLENNSLLRSGYCWGAALMCGSLNFWNRSANQHQEGDQDQHGQWIPAGPVKQAGSQASVLFPK